MGRAFVNIDALLNRTTTTYDRAGRAIANINALGQRTTTTYAGRTIASINPLR